MSVLKEKPKDTFRRRRELLEICINSKSMSKIDTFLKSEQFRELFANHMTSLFATIAETLVQIMATCSAAT